MASPSPAWGRSELSVMGAGSELDVRWQFLFRMDRLLKFGKIKHNGLNGISQNNDRRIMGST